MKIGDEIVRKRENAGISQVTLANMVDISQPYLSDIENGNRTGSKQVLKKIAAILGISFDEREGAKDDVDRP